MLEKDNVYVYCLILTKLPLHFFGLTDKAAVRLPPFSVCQMIRLLQPLKFVPSAPFNSSRPVQTAID